MAQKPMETKGEKQRYTALSTEYNHRHSRMKEEFPEGSYGSSPDIELGKTSGWDTGEEVNPQFSYENEELHEASARQKDVQADPIRTNPENHQR